MPISSLHPEYEDMLGRWVVVKDVVRSNVKTPTYIKDVEDLSSITVERAAENKINETDQGSRGLVKYNGNKIYKAACSRNTRYRDDAIFTNFTARTKNTLVGAVFKKDIVTDNFPAQIEYLITDATGTRVTLNRLGQMILGKILETGRYGLLVDYPASEDGLTQKEVEELNLKARIYTYEAESIINWSTTLENGLPKLSLVVLKEVSDELAEDGYEWVKKIEYRVLRLQDGEYIQSVFDEDLNLTKEYTPRDFNGNTWDEIPFIFVGAENNDPKVDTIPLYDIAMINLGHLRNSADYEEAVFICGQPTLMISTETPFDIFNEWNPDGIKIGSRRGYNLGVNAKAWFLQPSANIAALEAMRLKESQAQMIGARFTTVGGTNETAEGVRMRLTGDTSELTIYALNTQDALIQAAKYCARFMIGDAWEAATQDIKIVVNTDFLELTIDAQKIQQLVTLVQNNIISKNDARDMLREAGDLGPERTNDVIEGEIMRQIVTTDPLAG